MSSKYKISEPIISSFNDIDASGYYSYADYLQWQFEERVELLKGKIFKMSPAPNRMHQEISMILSNIIYRTLQNSPCKVYSAPFDVRLISQGKEDEQITTVVQPDICVICDHSKLDDRGCIGAPDLIIEILSPSNDRHDLKRKFFLYEEHGVQEYWIVDPRVKTIVKHVLTDGKYVTQSPPYFTEDTLTTDILPGLEINVEEIFKE